MTHSEYASPVNRWLNWLPTVIVLAAVFWLLRYLSDVLIPFAIAVVLAYLLNPLVTLLERKMRRGLAVALSLVGLVFVAGLMLRLIVPLMASQVERFGHDLRKLKDDLSTSFTAPASDVQTNQNLELLEAGLEQQRLRRTSLGWTELKNAWREYRRTSKELPRSKRLAIFRTRLHGTYLGNVLEVGIVDLTSYVHTDEFKNLLIDTVKKLAVGGVVIFNFALNIVLIAVALIIIVVYVVFLLLDFPEYVRSWKTFLPPTHRETTVEFLEEFSAAMRRYFRGQAVVSLLTATLAAIGFTLIGLPMAVPFGLFYGLLSMVPYLAWISVVPALFLALLHTIETETSLIASLGLLFLVFGSVQVLQDALITPRVMGQATGLRPIVILLGLFIWGKLLGFLGLVLAIPLTCLFIAYYRRYVLKHSLAETRIGVGSEQITRPTGAL